MWDKAAQLRLINSLCLLFFHNKQLNHQIYLTELLELTDVDIFL